MCCCSNQRSSKFVWCRKFFSSEGRKRNCTAKEFIAVLFLLVFICSCVASVTTALVQETSSFVWLDSMVSMVTLAPDWNIFFSLLIFLWLFELKSIVCAVASRNYQDFTPEKSFCRFSLVWIKNTRYHFWFCCCSFSHLNLHKSLEPTPEWRTFNQWTKQAGGGGNTVKHDQ